MTEVVFSTPDYLRLIGMAILDQAQNLNEYERLADLQALASVNRAARRVISEHPDLKIARETHANLLDEHEESPYDRNERCDNIVEPCGCTETGEWCNCSCHARCQYCGDPHVDYTGCERNKSVTSEDCGFVQWFAIAMYTHGNVCVAKYFLSQLDPSVTRLIENGHVALATHLCDNKLIQQKTWAMPEANALMEAALKCPVDQQDAAFRFVVSQPLNDHWTWRDFLDRALCNALHVYPHLGSRVTMEIVAGHFSAPFASRYTLCTMARNFMVYGTTRVIDSGPDLALRWTLERLKLCAGVLWLDSISTVFEHARAIKHNRAASLAETLRRAMRLLYALEPLVDDWRQVFTLNGFKIVNKAILVPSDFGALSMEQAERSRKRLKVAVKEGGFADRPSYDEGVHQQQTMLDYMNFISSRLPNSE